LEYAAVIRARRNRGDRWAARAALHHTPDRVAVAPAGALALITAACAADPVLDIALSHALLADVAGGRRAPALRIFRPGPTVAFGRLDALLPGFDAARALAREHGFTPVLRSVGGHAAVFDERCVVVEHFTHEQDATAGLQSRFERQARLVRDALGSLGVDARIGQLPGEYCAGEHSVNLGGRVKVAGIAQRVVRHGAMTSAVVVAGGGAELRAAIASVYAALDVPVDPATAGALDEELRDVTVEDVARELGKAYADRAVARAIDGGLLGAAGALVERHRLR
jgi:octanoyl-[GcvH]:protein N-octanoyltransferase